MRQSTLRQVLTNTESATRQYALRQKAVALGFHLGGFAMFSAALS